MNFLTAHSLEETSPLAARQVSERLLAQSPHSPSLLLVYFTQAHDAEELRRHLKLQFPTTRLIGCSSCGGVMTQVGHHARQGIGLAVAALYDDKGAYGVAG
ncbi:FIST N-terminal domain-containing protein, partial [Aeromonas piscicola]|uniref:FIST N-terminal domain-containing protein n=1 Tax=Aeromonas piscicola TaxID=600645 RepID=UPI003B8A89EB